MECVDYWKMKSWAAAAESPIDTYLSGRYSAAGWVINRDRNP
jgi:hypothetical protein